MRHINFFRGARQKVYVEKVYVLFPSLRFWGRKWLRQFIGAWHFLVLPAGEKPRAHKLPRFADKVSGFFFGRGGGVEVPILFLGAWGFFPIPGRVRRRCLAMDFKEQRVHRRILKGVCEEMALGRQNMPFPRVRPLRHVP